MKGKKVLRVLVAAIVVTMLFAQIVAMADESYTTATTYDISSGKASVTTTVYGIRSGDEVTFLVTDNSDIIYIDQISTSDYVAIDGESAQFNFLTDVSHAHGTAEVSVGSSTSGKLSDPGSPDNTIVLDKDTITYSVTGNGHVYVGNSASASSSGSEEEYPGDSITFYFAPDAGYELSAVYKDGEPFGAITSANSSYNYLVTGDAVLEFVFSAASDDDLTATIVNDAAGTGDYASVLNGASIDENAMTSFAAITNIKAAKEFGIIVSKNQTVLEGITDISELSSAIPGNGRPNEVYKFSAFGSIGGKFGVKLVNGTKSYLTGTVYSRAYVKSFNDACNFAATVSHVYGE